MKRGREGRGQRRKKWRRQKGEPVINDSTAGKETSGWSVGRQAGSERVNSRFDDELEEWT